MCLNLSTLCKLTALGLLRWLTNHVRWLVKTAGVELEKRSEKLPLFPKKNNFKSHLPTTGMTIKESTNISLDTWSVRAFLHLVKIPPSGFTKIRFLK